MFIVILMSTHFVCRMGLNSMLNEVIEAEDADDEDEEDDKKPMSDFDALKSGLLDAKEGGEDENGEIIKDNDAVDYSDITELSEDCPKTPPSDLNKGNEVASTLEDLEDAIPASKVQSNAGNSATKDDKELMPPPSTPIRTQSNSGGEGNKSSSDSGMDSDSKTDKSM